MVNRYAGKCGQCGSKVPAKGGTLRKIDGTFVPFHLTCDGSAGSGVIEVRFSSGHTITRNRRGTCEDAPCCGCCTF